MGASIRQGKPPSMRGPQSRAGCRPTNVITTDATTGRVSKTETAAVSESMSTDAFTSTSESIHANDIDTIMTATPATTHKLKVHIKIDTGMGRLGLQPNDEAISYITRAVEHLLLDVEGVYTHFACADEADKAYTLEQHRKFERIIRHLEERGVTFRYVHTGNSAAGIDCPELSYSMVRLGIGMYGLYPSEEVNKERVQLEPVMSIKTRAVHVKTLPAGSGISYGTTYHTSGEECIATLPIGYADGYSRMLSGKAQAIVRGRKVPIVGRICMDQCMANVSGLGDLSKEEEVVLMGRQQDEAITAEDLAALLGTVNYEITCMVSHRVPRVYIRDGRREDVLNPLIR
ncbi:alanine racemase [Paenibacillus sp. IB182363]|uniref:Alanine racemase n=2 Tax=Paenibacillus oceani TaxID=2772510 RepID=A0A927CDX2_9BACL|nr:alanine racemase [Paenibacillus oceani]